MTTRIQLWTICGTLDVREERLITVFWRIALFVLGNMDYKTEGCLHEVFSHQAKKTPSATAVVSDDGRSLTFSELDRITDVLAINLRHKGCKKDSTVGIYLERSLEYVITYIAALKAGGAYLPLEFSYPEHLLRSVLDDAKPVAVVTSAQMEGKLPSSITKIVVSEGWEKRLTAENDAETPLEDKPASNLGDLAYVVYSSGTTGRPKGICCPHRGSVLSYMWRLKKYPFQEDERVACNVFFTWEMLRSMLVGIPLYIIPDTVIYDPPLLLNFLQKHKITRILFTPSLLEAVLACSEVDIPSHLSHLRVIWLCGEVFTTALRDRCMKTLPWIKLLNLYSISECHDVAAEDLTYFPFQDQLPDNDENKRKFCPVGKILPGVQVVIMDCDMNSVPVGVSGEILVGGPTLARGYLKRPELNALRFIDRPPGLPVSIGPRLYRTGDWGYMLSSGQLEICGRCNSMVKIRGYSIEIQAVEAALLQLPMVNACVVLAHGEEGSNKYLVAYVVPEGQATKKEIRAVLKTMLPFYMVPAHFLLLSSIPVSAAGKLDKTKLPSVESDEGGEEGLPNTATERALAQLWCQVLGVKSVDVHESFFDLGGHSLLATRLLAKVAETVGQQLSVSDLFQYPSIAEMAKLIDKNGNSTAKPRSLSLEHDIDLKAEVTNHDQGFVNMDIILRAFWRSGNFKNSRRWNRGHVLLTGATGYLGAFLLRDLLVHTKVHVYCIVRELPDVSVKDRLKKNLQNYKILPPPDKGYQMSEEERYLEHRFEHRVIVLRGDVSLRNLGTSEEEYVHLLSEIDFIVHAAAAVNMVYPYLALRGPNVSGTQNILLFACTSKIKPLYYISSNAVFPHGLNNCSEDSDMLQYASQLTDGYAQSKWVAEQLVLRARARGLPVVIFRLGNMVGDRKYSRWNSLDFTLLVLRGCVRTLSAPDVDWKMEMTPVDFASEMIIKLTQEASRSLGRIFHIVNPFLLDVKWLFEWMYVRGYPMHVVPFDKWKQTIEAHDKSKGDEQTHSLVRLLDTWIRDPSFFSRLSSYTSTDFVEEVKHFQESYPLIDNELLTHYFMSLAAQNVLPPPKRNVRGPRPLEGQVAIVTGASSGIGAAVARALSEAGAKVAVVARRKDRLDQLQSDLSANDAIVLPLAADVVKREEVKEAVKHTVETLGTIDILVNSAGVMYYTMMKNCHENEWDHQIDVNCKGVMNCIGAVLPGMLQKGKGHIVNISSNAGRKGFPGLAVYSGTKFFVEGMSQALRQEMAGTGIKVTTVQPGDVTTEIGLRTTDKEAQEKFDASNETRILEPKDIASSVVFAVTQPPYCAVNEILVEPRDAPY